MLSCGAVDLRLRDFRLFYVACEGVFIGRCVWLSYIVLGLFFIVGGPDMWSPPGSPVLPCVTSSFLLGCSLLVG
jgi:hypothetical protein